MIQTDALDRWATQPYLLCNRRANGWVMPLRDAADRSEPKQPPTRPRTWRFWALSIFMLWVAVMTLWFVDHASRLGIAGLTTDLSDTSRLYSPNQTANIAIFSHMILGAIITLLAPLQLVPALRGTFPKLHRWSGRVIVLSAFGTALGGLAYMALRGTVGGPPMTMAFTLYGLLVAGSAIETIRHARAGRWTDHRDWAVRLFFLCIASLLYRVHYGLWFTVMGDSAPLYVQDDFRGAFDLFNIWAFYVPYLLVVELVLLRHGRGVFAGARRWAA